MKRACSLLILGLGLAVGGHANVYNDNVVIVLDASGSMKEPLGSVQKMDAAKKAIAEVLKMVPDTTQVGLLVFSGNGKSHDWVHPLGPRDDAALLAALRPIRPSGSTPLGEYIKVGADRLLAGREKQLGYGSYRLLVVTDGEASDADLMKRYTPDVLSRGILLDVIGVDMKKAHALATQANSYRRADNAASLQDAIAEVMAEVSVSDSGVAQDNAFALIAPLPNEVAASMLRALGKPNNAPIGVVRAEEAPHAAAPPPPDHATHTSSRSGRSGFRFGGLGWVVLIALVALVSIIKKVVKS